MSQFETNSSFSAGDVAKALMASFQGSHAVLIFFKKAQVSIILSLLSSPVRQHDIQDIPIVGW